MTITIPPAYPGELADRKSDSILSFVEALQAVRLLRLSGAGRRDLNAEPAEASLGRSRHSGSFRRPENASVAWHALLGLVFIDHGLDQRLQRVGVRSLVLTGGMAFVVATSVELWDPVGWPLPAVYAATILIMIDSHLIVGERLVCCRRHVAILSFIRTCTSPRPFKHRGVEGWHGSRFLAGVDGDLFLFLIAPLIERHHVIAPLSGNIIGFDF